MGTGFMQWLRDVAKNLFSLKEEKPPCNHVSRCNLQAEPGKPDKPARCKTCGQWRKKPCE